MRHSILTIVLCAAASGANAVDFAIGASAGTPGVAVNATLGLTKQLNVRGIFNYFQYGFDDSENGVDYELDLDLNSFGALLDWHPMGGAFRLSGGVFANSNEITGNGRGQPGTTVDFGNITVDADDLGVVDAFIEFNGVAPYLGLGWGNAVGDGRWAFMADIGVFFQGDPKATIDTPDVDPTIATMVAAEVANAEAELENNVDSLSLYPYVSIGFAFKF